MMRSLYSGITGLRNHQTRMDIIGNNIANVNTVGFKASRVVFQELFSQTLQGASAPTTQGGGLNPRQIGLGVTIAAIDVLHTPSASQMTNAPLDVMIDGDGFFVVRQGSSTTAMEYYTRAGNFGLDKNNHLVNSSGMYVQGYAVDPKTGDLTTTPGTGITQIQVEQEDFYDVKIDEYGILTGVARDTITVGGQTFQAGETVKIAALQIAAFSNNTGLEKCGSNLYRSTGNSGAALLGTANTPGRGSIKAGYLEMSNVDLAGEFTDMIVTQRGFQANSRTITTSDAMLEELVNLKR